jgi:hypothetical protein
MHCSTTCNVTKAGESVDVMMRIQNKDDIEAMFTPHFRRVGS